MKNYVPEYDWVLFKFRPHFKNSTLASHNLGHGESHSATWQPPISLLPWDENWVDV